MLNLSHGHTIWVILKHPMSIPSAFMGWSFELSTASPISKHTLGHA